MKKFADADAKTPPIPGRILFVGSSSIVLWDVQKSFPDLDIINRGFGGSLLSDTVHYFDRVVLPYQPRTIVVYAGDNDIAASRTPQQVADQFKQLVEKVKKQIPKAKLVFIGIKPSIKRWDKVELVREANELIKAQIAGLPGVVYVDVDAPMIGKDGKPLPELLAKDGLHLSPAGYELWDSLVRPHIVGDSRLSKGRELYDRYHPWVPPTSFEEWKVESEKIRQRVLVSNGLWPMPEKQQIKPVIHGKLDMGDYTVEKVFFESSPGLLVTGSLYRPKTVEGKIPGILCAHGHAQDGRMHESSDASVPGSYENGGEQFRSGAKSYIQSRAVQLVRMGTVVFLYDMIGYADHGPLSHRQGFSDADAALWLHNKMGLQTWNSIRALDFLVSLPDVDPSRIGVTGESGGGTQTFMLCAVDQRPTVAFPAVMVGTAMQGGCICENADYLRVGQNNIAIAALMAPRPLAMSGANDWTINIETRGLPELKQVYGFYGQADLVTAKCFPQFGHNYNQPAREMMYDWFNAHLNLGLKSPVKQQDYWPLTRAQQTVFTDQHPRPATALEEAPLRDQLRARDRQQFDSLNQDNYEATIRPAVNVLLPPAKGEIQIVSGSEKEIASNLKREEFTVRSAQMLVPVTLLTPKTATQKVVLWLDGAGKSHLMTENGTPEAAVSEILNSGYAVAGADLLLTGGTSSAENPYLEKMKSTSPSHQAAKAGEDYTGFLYGYNLTLIAERINDIDRTVKALKSKGFNEVTLVGTGDAGLWALLARSRMGANEVTSTIVDLNQFRFGKIDSSLDLNMLPGALRYGGVGGIAALSFPASLTVHGVGDANDSELSPLSKRYSNNGNLKLSADSLSREGVVASVVKK
ncbi:GDSL-type esterase/lipase family protein [Planctomicrobium sp. SH527]|uniref:GDSL-type esterase/lipase family protein n=1 Tax=Planctomicrobium sp. SH527 TaxID=3448123 RepID=UPI003F5B32FD